MPLSIASTYHLNPLESDLLAALKIARRHVIDIDSYLAKYEPSNRYTVGDLMKIETAIARAERRA